MAFSVRADVKEVNKFLTSLERKQVPFSTRLALRNTAYQIAKKDIPRVLPVVFDRPTRWTKNAFYSYQPKGEKVLDAYVNIKDGGSNQPGRGGRPGTPGFKYLRFQMVGGTRRAKSHEKQLRRLGILGANEYTVPGDAMRLNRFGNLTAATYAKILADVQAKNYSTPAASRYDVTAGQATLKRGKKRYFYDPNLKPRGIYLRKSRKRLVLALLFVKTPFYRARFKFSDIAERRARRRFPVEFRKAMRRAIETAK